jgi:hypothetical protein
MCTIPQLVTTLVSIHHNINMDTQRVEYIPNNMYLLSYLDKKLIDAGIDPVNFTTYTVVLVTISIGLLFGSRFFFLALVWLCYPYCWNYLFLFSNAITDGKLEGFSSFNLVAFLIWFCLVSMTFI